MDKNSTTWTQLIWQDLQPTPGRLGSSLRIVLSTIIALILLLIWQMPFASLGLFLIFIVSRDNPAISLRSGVFTVLTAVAAVAVELGVVILTDNDPMARLLSVTIVAFLAGLLLMATTVPVLAQSWGFLYCTVIALWEIKAPADSLVKTSLWLLASASVCIGCAIAVEYIFGARNPAEALLEQRRIRYQALDTLFTLYAEGADSNRLAGPITHTIQLASEGQFGMQRLYSTIVDRDLDTSSLPVGARVRITMLAQLMDLAAAFATQYKTVDNPAMRQQCSRIAARCHSLIPGLIEVHEQPQNSGAANSPQLLDRVEQVLYTILSMPQKAKETEQSELVALPSKKLPFLIPGALKNKDNIAFALKISLCATTCYVLYHAVDWPGISTAVTTVFVTGLSTSGAIKQKSIYRILGSAIGGLVFGLGATAFLFPHMDTITSLVLLVAAISFISAWFAGGRRFNYIGLQIAFSFFLVTFEGFSASTQLAPARDRLIGILLALLIMWFVFDQIWPVRTVTEMRRSLALVLRDEATLLRLRDSLKDHSELVRQSDILRDQLGKSVAGLRTMSTAVEYEFGANREAQLHTSELILHAALTAVALFWNQISIIHIEQDQSFAREPHLIAMRHKLAEEIEVLADAVIHKTTFPIYGADHFLDPAFFADPHFGQYAHTSMNSYLEIQTLVSQLNSSV